MTDLELTARILRQGKALVRAIEALGTMQLSGAAAAGSSLRGAVGLPQYCRDKVVLEAGK